MGRANRTRSMDGPVPRTWARSTTLALVIVAVAIGTSAVINPLLGRVVHWNIMAVLMPSLFVAATVLLRKRWV